MRFENIIFLLHDWNTHRNDGAQYILVEKSPIKWAGQKFKRAPTKIS